MLYQQILEFVSLLAHKITGSHTCTLQHYVIFVHYALVWRERDQVLLGVFIFFFLVADITTAGKSQTIIRNVVYLNIFGLF